MYSFLLLCWTLNLVIVVMEEVPGFWRTDNGSHYQAWQRLWHLAGYHFVTRMERTDELLPLRRDRLIMTAVHHHLPVTYASLERTLSLPGLPALAQCPLRRGVRS